MGKNETHLRKGVIDRVVSQLQKGEEDGIGEENGHPLKQHPKSELLLEEVVTPYTCVLPLQRVGDVLSQRHLSPRHDPFNVHCPR